MKSILLIGLGDFGHYLCRKLAELKTEIMIIDKREEALEDLLDVATSSLIADCSQNGVLSRIGVKNFDLCFVCIGNSFQDNLVITHRLKELGAKYVVSQVNDEMLEGFLMNNGADEILHPNRETAIRAAVRHADDRVFDYIELKDGHSIYEITPLKEWVGKSILESNIRVEYNTYIISVLNSNGHMDVMPSPDYVIRADDHLMVLASVDTIEKLLK